MRDFSNLLRDTVDHEMAREAATLRDNDAAHGAIKQWVEMPNPDADRIITSLLSNGWAVTSLTSLCVKGDSITCRVRLWKS